MIARWAMVFILCAASARCAEECEVEREAVNRAQETVVLLHGMGRTRASMWVLGCRFRKMGYKTRNFPYKIRKDTLDEFAEQLHVAGALAVPGEVLAHPVLHHGLP